MRVGEVHPLRNNNLLVPSAFCEVLAGKRSKEWATTVDRRPTYSCVRGVCTSLTMILRIDTAVYYGCYHTGVLYVWSSNLFDFRPNISMLHEWPGVFLLPRKQVNREGRAHCANHKLRPDQRVPIKSKVGEGPALVPPKHGDFIYDERMTPKRQNYHNNQPNRTRHNETEK